MASSAVKDCRFGRHQIFVKPVPVSGTGGNQSIVPEAFSSFVTLMQEVSQMRNSLFRSMGILTLLMTTTAPLSKGAANPPSSQPANAPVLAPTGMHPGFTPANGQPRLTRPPLDAETIAKIPKKTLPWLPLPMADKERASPHESFVARAKKGDIDILFLGDDPFAYIQNSDVWIWYSAHKAESFAIKDTLTENMLWRISDGELDGLKPQLIILEVGAVNVEAIDQKGTVYSDDGHLLLQSGHKDTPEEIAKAVLEISSKIVEKVPNSKVLILSLLPRVRTGATADFNADWSFKKRVNDELAKAAKGTNVKYLDVSSALLDKERKGKNDMYDYNGRGRSVTVAGLREIDKVLRPAVEAMLR
jgi:hypothetical protein